jgi:hypothetical protein
LPKKNRKKIKTKQKKAKKNKTKQNKKERKENYIIESKKNKYIIYLI